MRTTITNMPRWLKITLALALVFLLWLTWIGFFGSGSGDTGEGKAATGLISHNLAPDRDSDPSNAGEPLTPGPAPST